MESRALICYDGHIIMNKTAVIILAAGQGTRMPNRSLPKALLRVGDVSMVERVVRAVEQSKLTDQPVVVIGHKGASIKRVLGSRARYVWQRRQLGTGHAVTATRTLLQGKAGQVIVLYGDHPLLRPTTLQRLARLRAKRRAVITCVVTLLSDFRGPRQPFRRNFGRMIRDRRGQLIKSVEFKDATPRERSIREVNPGYYCFDAEWLWANLSKLTRRNAQRQYYVNGLLALATAQGETVAILPSRDWVESLGVNTEKERQIAEKVAKITKAIS